MWTVLPRQCKQSEGDVPTSAGVRFHYAKDNVAPNDNTVSSERQTAALNLPPPSGALHCCTNVKANEHIQHTVVL